MKSEIGHMGLAILAVLRRRPAGLTQPEILRELCRGNAVFAPSGVHVVVSRLVQYRVLKRSNNAPRARDVRYRLTAAGRVKFRDDLLVLRERNQILDSILAANRHE